MLTITSENISVLEDENSQFTGDVGTWWGEGAEHSTSLTLSDIRECMCKGKASSDEARGWEA